MFEKYTERARRVIFFARYESNKVGGTAIYPEHLLIGMLREDKALFVRLGLSKEEGIDVLDKAVKDKIVKAEAGNASRDLPLSLESKKVLAEAIDVFEKHQDQSLRTKHILFGILKQRDLWVVQILADHGVTHESVSALLTDKTVS